MHDSHGQNRALASRSKSLKSLKVSLFARKPLGMRNEDAGVLVGRPSAQPTLLLPQKALCGGIPGAVLEPLVRFWSHFVGIYRQKLTRSLEN